MRWPISFFQDPLRRSIGLRPALRRHRALARRLCFEPLEDRLALSSSPVAPPSADFSGLSQASAFAMQAMSNEQLVAREVPGQTAGQGPVAGQVQAVGQIQTGGQGETMSTQRLPVAGGQTNSIAAGTDPPAADPPAPAPVAGIPDQSGQFDPSQLYQPGGAQRSSDAILVALEAAVPVQPAVPNPNVMFPTDRFQQAPTPYGLSGNFTDTGLPHAYEDEQLLAGRRVIASRPIRDLTPPGALTPARPSKPTQDQQPPHQRRVDDVRPMPPVAAQPPRALDNSRLTMTPTPVGYGQSGRLGAEAVHEHAAVDAVMAALDEMRVVSDGLYLTGPATGGEAGGIRGW